MLSNLAGVLSSKLGTVLAYTPAKTERERAFCFILKLFNVSRFKF